MPYDADSRTVRWFEEALSAASARVRGRAVDLLRDVSCPARERWLREAAGDLDPRVAALAVVVAALPATAGSASDEFELFESDFATGALDSELHWEWEYKIVVCRDLYVPSAGVLVWTREENDAHAKQLALLKACVGQASRGEESPIITAKRFVNLYTRSPRSLSEAMRWSARGRPGYGDPHDPR